MSVIQDTELGTAGQLDGAVTVRPRRALAALLSEAGIASEEQVQQALAESLSSGQGLAEVVRRAGWINEEQLAELLAREWRLTYAEPNQVTIDHNARGVLPSAEWERLEACPFAFDENGVAVVAIAEPSDERLGAVRERLGGDCLFAVTTASTLEWLLEQPRAARPEPRTAPLSAPPAPIPAEETEELNELEKQFAHFVQGVEQLLDERKQSAAERDQYEQQIAALNAGEARSQERIRVLEAELRQRNQLVRAIGDKLAEFTETVARESEPRDRSGPDRSRA
jgi:hypothetical protein